jgi:hypothetical protein
MKIGNFEILADFKKSKYPLLTKCLPKTKNQKNETIDSHIFAFENVFFIFYI